MGNKLKTNKLRLISVNMKTKWPADLSSCPNPLALNAINNPIVTGTRTTLTSGPAVRPQGRAGRGNTRCSRPGATI